MQPASLQLFGALQAALAIGAGAFGAHALKDRLSPYALDVWKTSSHYHLWGALALLVLGIIAERRALGAAPLLFQVGLIVFCGTLYVLAVSGQRWLGAITPLGGTAMIVAWVWVAWQLWSHTKA